MGACVSNSASVTHCTCLTYRARVACRALGSCVSNSASVTYRTSLASWALGARVTRRALGACVSNSASVAHRACLTYRARVARRALGACVSNSASVTHWTSLARWALGSCITRRALGASRASSRRAGCTYTSSRSSRTIYAVQVHVVHNVRSKCACNVLNVADGNGTRGSRVSGDSAFEPVCRIP